MLSSTFLLQMPGFHLGGGGGLEIVLLKFIIDVEKCLTKCMSSESMHM